MGFIHEPRKLFSVITAGNAMTAAERRALEALGKYGPQFNGSLAAHANVVWNSRLFARMEKAGLISGHRDRRGLPYSITDAGRAALASIKKVDDNG